MPDQRDPTELVRAAADGDQAAWEALVTRYSGVVWSVGHSFRFSSADIADIAQTVWLILLENLGKLRKPSHLPGWLATTTRRECLRVLNKRGREIPSDTTAALDNVVDGQAAVDEPLLARERDAKVRAAFRALPERCQRLLRVLLRDPPPSYTEASALLVMPVGSIGPTRGRCLDILRESLNLG